MNLMYESLEADRAEAEYLKDKTAFERFKYHLVTFLIPTAAIMAVVATLYVAISIYK